MPLSKDFSVALKSTDFKLPDSTGNQSTEGYSLEVKQTPKMQGQSRKRTNIAFLTAALRNPESHT